MSKMDKLKEIIRELIRNELDEASTSANVPGYQHLTHLVVVGRKIRRKRRR